MRLLHPAGQGRKSRGDKRTSIAEYAMTSALIAVALGATVLWLVAQFNGR